jgi:hypothetical protein
MFLNIVPSVIFHFFALIGKHLSYHTLFWEFYSIMEMSNGWKRKLLEEASQVFDGESKGQKVKEDAQTQIDELYRQIGQLKVERDFLANRSAQLGLPTEKPW